MSTIINLSVKKRVEVHGFAINSRNRINTTLVKCFASFHRRISVDRAGNQKLFILIGMSKTEVWRRRLNYYLLLLQIMLNENVKPIIPAVNDPNYFIDMRIFNDHLCAMLLFLLNVILAVPDFWCPHTNLLKDCHSNIFPDACLFWSLLIFGFFKLPFT